MHVQTEITMTRGNTPQKQNVKSEKIYIIFTNHR